MDDLGEYSISLTVGPWALLIGTLISCIVIPDPGKCSFQGGLISFAQPSNCGRTWEEIRLKFIDYLTLSTAYRQALATVDLWDQNTYTVTYVYTLKKAMGNITSELIFKDCTVGFYFFKDTIIHTS